MPPRKLATQQVNSRRSPEDGQDTLQPLPNDADGPSLPAWPISHDKITFLKRLGYQQQERKSPPHGRVFLVDVASRKYALKIFRFFDIAEIRGYDNDKRLARLMPDHHVRHHLDPFFAECRAFARLKDEGQDGKLAVKCHGYLLLDLEMEQRLNTQFGELDWGRSEEHEGQPLRAILKDYLRYHDPYRPRTFSRMNTILLKLNTKHRILNMDIKEENYLGGRLFDFSISITAPHILFQRGVREKDRNQLDLGNDISCLAGLCEKQEKRRQAYLASLRKRPRRSRTIQ